MSPRGVKRPATGNIDNRRLQRAKARDTRRVGQADIQWIRPFKGDRRSGSNTETVREFAPKLIQDDCRNVSTTCAEVLQRGPIYSLAFEKRGPVPPKECQRKRPDRLNQSGQGLQDFCNIIHREAAGVDLKTTATTGEDDIAIVASTSEKDPVLTLDGNFRVTVLVIAAKSSLRFYLSESKTVHRLSILSQPVLFWRRREDLGYTTEGRAISVEEFERHSAFGNLVKDATTVVWEQIDIPDVDVPSIEREANKIGKGNNEVNMSTLQEQTRTTPGRVPRESAASIRVNKCRGDSITSASSPDKASSASSPGRKSSSTSRPESKFPSASSPRMKSSSSSSGPLSPRSAAHPPSRTSSRPRLRLGGKSTSIPGSSEMTVPDSATNTPSAYFHKRINELLATERQSTVSKDIGQCTDSPDQKGLPTEDVFNSIYSVVQAINAVQPPSAGFGVVTLGSLLPFIDGAREPVDFDPLYAGLPLLLPWAVNSHFTLLVAQVEDGCIIIFLSTPDGQVTKMCLCRKTQRGLLGRNTQLPTRLSGRPAITPSSMLGQSFSGSI
ncbi:hypothetical protein K458DRAFT_399781 [Lentithecium fluviatile CBS 122367]|uniref:Ubiquitin-like protease family profile domain-containing protein n=1 Tax=Lentithecium fluviatile CBS 122367 TaxID=1168545 RepID=A0A6G1JJ26_9PLEO|nr:hypothetical protein K458DRAFT_399781 [Lentithecium fluviatile CBS 122367]